MKSKPPATDVPKYWSPGATAEALILCGGETQGVGEGRGFLSFYSVNRLARSRDTEALEEKVRFSQGKWHWNRGLKGVGLDREGKEIRGWGNSQGSVQWERGDWAPGGLMWGWGVPTELHFRTPL